MSPKEIRYYLHNLDGLKQEIADIEADLGQYRAMSTDNFRVNSDPDPYKDKPEPDESQHSKHSDHSSVESLVVSRVTFIERLEKELFTKKTVMSAIKCVMFYMSPTEQRLIYLRYTKHFGWVKTGREMSYTDINCKKIDWKIVNDILNTYHKRLK